MPSRWSNRDVTSAAEAACVFASDFAQACKALGDMSNYYRWRMVLQDLRRFSASSEGLPLGSAVRSLRHQAEAYRQAHLW